jgi:predicted CoA-substrate-specific enzyme activase
MWRKIREETFFAGVDIGSRSSKAVVVNQDNKVVGDALIDTDVIPSRSGRQVLEQALARARVDWSQLKGIVATGYGRVQADFAHKTITEISCHAQGVHATDNRIRTIIDIGGQDSKVIKLDETGRVVDFAMNDRCAAGTGKFLEVMSRALGASLDEFAKLYFKSRQPCGISSVCTVFAESEVISLLAEGHQRENIIAGLHQAVAKRVANMALRLGVEQKIGFTGGVAKNQGMVRALEQELGSKFCRLKYNPQMIGALGAAIIARGNGG